MVERLVRPGREVVEDRGDSDLLELDAAGLTGSGIVSDLVPVAGLAVNFSSMPQIATPPLGRVICGGANSDGSAVAPVRSSRPDDGTAIVHSSHVLIVTRS